MPFLASTTCVIKLKGCSVERLGFLRVGMHDSPVFLICLRSWDGLQFYRGKCVMTEESDEPLFRLCFYIPQDLQENNTLLGNYAKGISTGAVHHLSEFFHSIINAEKGVIQDLGKEVEYACSQNLP